MRGQTNLSMNNEYGSLHTLSVAHHPTRQKLIIARVELVLAKPVVMREAVEELEVFEGAK